MNSKQVAVHRFVSSVKTRFGIAGFFIIALLFALLVYILPTVVFLLISVFMFDSEGIAWLGWTYLALSGLLALAFLIFVGYLLYRYGKESLNQQRPTITPEHVYLVGPALWLSNIGFGGFVLFIVIATFVNDGFVQGAITAVLTAILVPIIKWVYSLFTMGCLALLAVIGDSTSL